MDINETMTAVFDIMNEGVLIIDERSRIVYANRAYCDFLETGLEKIQGLPLR